MSVEPVFHFNMPQLTLLLKRQAEQNPSASYFNVDILKVHKHERVEGGGVGVNSLLTAISIDFSLFKTYLILTTLSLSFCASLWK